MHSSACVHVCGCQCDVGNWLCQWQLPAMMAMTGLRFNWCCDKPFFMHFPTVCYRLWIFTTFDATNIPHTHYISAIQTLRMLQVGRHTIPLISLKTAVADDTWDFARSSQPIRCEHNILFAWKIQSVFIEHPSFNNIIPFTWFYLRHFSPHFATVCEPNFSEQ